MASLDWVVRGDLSEKVSISQIFEGSKAAKVWKKGIPGRGTRICEGSGPGVSSVFSKGREKPTPLEQSGRQAWLKESGPGWWSGPRPVGPLATGNMDFILGVMGSCLEHLGARNQNDYFGCLENGLLGIETFSSN